jgi:hypothetical protein
MSEQEQNQKDIFQMMGESIEPAVKAVGAGASEMKEATGGVVGMMFRRESSRLLHKFYNRRIARRMR